MSPLKALWIIIVGEKFRGILSFRCVFFVANRMTHFNNYPSCNFIPPDPTEKQFCAIFDHFLMKHVYGFDAYPHFFSFSWCADFILIFFGELIHANIFSFLRILIKKIHFIFH